jgi:hypothetical protein
VDGAVALELVGDQARKWGTWPGPRGPWLAQRVGEPTVDNPVIAGPDGKIAPEAYLPRFADGSITTHTLTITWGK